VRGTGRRRLVWVLIAAIAIVLLWLAGDFTYSRVVLHRYEKWNNAVERDADGVRVGCRDFTVGSGDTALLFIHGYSDSPAIFKKMAARLADRGFTCRAMLRPGCARPLEQYAQATNEKWRVALEQEVAALYETHERVWIIAHSLGGAITINYLLDHPDAVDGVVLLGPLIAVSPERSPVLSPRDWYRIGKKMVIFTDIVENPFEVEAHSADARTYDGYSRYVPRKVYDEIFEITDDNEGRGAELKLPILMVLSRNDNIVDSSAAHDYYKAISSRRKRLLWLEDAYHMIPIDTGWEEVVEEIVAFTAISDGVEQ
jgi:carboxylesterase